MNGILNLPPAAAALYVMAHGAGAGMRHPFLESMASLLAERGVGTWRYEFAYVEAKKNRPDPPAAAAARVREAVLEAARQAPGLPLFAGGKSFGGRMTSTAQSEQPLTGVRGLIFLGFPLHAPGKPGIERAAHLDRVAVPMLFLQGTRDEFADPPLLGQVLTRLGARATLHAIEQGNHSFEVPRRVTGLSRQDVQTALAEAIVRWCRTITTR